jgi:hypothetical protein
MENDSTTPIPPVIRGRPVLTSIPEETDDPVLQKILTKRAYQNEYYRKNRASILAKMKDKYQNQKHVSLLE